MKKCQDNIESTLSSLRKLESHPIKLVKKDTETLYYDHHKGGLLQSEVIGVLYHCHRPGNNTILQSVYDKNDIIPKSNSEFEACLRKMSSTIKNHKEKVALKSFLDGGTDLHYPVPSLNPNTFFEGIDWPNVLDYWIYDGVQKDERLVDAFKSCIMPLPASEPVRYQPLNAHQVWVTNSGTGKSRFNTVYGNMSVKELTSAGLFGSNQEKYKGQITGMLQGSGMFMIDEVSELTVSNTKEPILNMLLSYLEQGQLTRAFKVQVTCEGTKTIILNSNPKTGDTTLNSLNRFINIIGGSDDDKVRVGRRLGLILFGNDYHQAVIQEVIDPRNTDFIRRQVMTSISMSSKTLYSLYNRVYPYLIKEEKSIVAELLDIANAIEGNPDVSDFLKGLALSTMKVKTAGFRLFLLDNLPLLYQKKSKLLYNMWAREKDEYIARMCDINMSSFKQVEGIKEETSDELIRSMMAEKLTLKQMSDRTKLHTSTLSRRIKRIKLQ